MFVGQRGDQLLSSDGPLAPFVPGQYAGMEAILQPGDIEKLSDDPIRLNVPVGVPFRLPVPHISPIEGRVESAGGGGLPLVIRAVRGFGELTWVGLDVDLAPLADWPGRPELLRRIIGVVREAQSSVAGASGRLTSLGYTDLVGQMRAALDVFPGVRVVPFAWVIGFTLLYLALLGPVDYLLVHRWGRRPLLTWLTLPVFVLVIAGGAYGLARATKGHAVGLNQVEVVDVDVASGLVRGTVWANLYTPRHDRFTLELAPQFPQGLSLASDEPDAVLSWLTLPGRGLGGVEAAADVAAFEQGYRYGHARSELAGLPLAIWSSKSLHGSWTAEAAPSLDSDLATNADGELVGRFTNGLREPLANARLYFAGRICRLDTVDPGEQIDLEGKLWVSASNELTGRTLSKDAPPYNAANRDPRRILQMMMWYQLAGGANYVGLINRYHARLEFTHLLDAGRAVLVAESGLLSPRAAPAESRRPPGTRIEQNGDLLTDASGVGLRVYRLVLPVTPQE
jgi:hypothetical protein